MENADRNSPGTWERIYQAGGQDNVAPYTEIFSFLNRHVQGKPAPGKLLELGSGVGNNLAFARWAMGWEVYGLEISPDAVARSKARFARHGLAFAELRQGSIPPIGYPDDYFDAIVDRATIQHNTLEAILEIISEVRRVLKPGGLFFSSVIAENHAQFGQGRDLGNGDFENPEVDGVRHFFSRAQIKEVYREFDILAWHLTTRQNMTDNRILNGVYNIEMRKRS